MIEFSKPSPRIFILFVQGFIFIGVLRFVIGVVLLVLDDGGGIVWVCFGSVCFGFCMVGVDLGGCFWFSLSFMEYLNLLLTYYLYLSPIKI